ncbi:efflux RND transporter periplasmic adaptor subunit [Catellatospora sp. KI3]|uniref:efflux RND transporter periplasmic adaptor subunit n=1 Tax=Catellatospora sp. KI3 TaxID=3041620 RepID=UPI00248225F9|nr:efflux RND transporter periplasmic adaptor subunit [Catellatospora sp. KI3]MDI1462777.1 efflux RND transporter periplasmic adaptor subunit [Catellatospora sp. KI3]
MRPLLHRSARPTLLLGTVLLTVSLSAASCDDAPEVTLAAVGRATVTEVVDAPAAVTARAAATLTAPAEGTLARLAVKPGQQVTRGQVLAVIAAPAAQSRLAQARQALDAARRSGGGSPSIDLRGAQRHLDKSAAEAFTQARTAAGQIADEQARQALLAQITAGERSYRQASAAVADAAGAVQRGVASLGSAMKALGAAQKLQAQQAYDLAKSTVDALTLRAPISGVVQLGGTSTAAAAPDLTSLLGGLGGGTGASGGGTTVPAGVAGVPAVGAPVSAGTAIVTIVDTSELGLVAEVDETDILLVETGIAAEAELDAAPGVAYPATVTAIDVLPTANSRGAVAYRVHLSLGALPAGAPTPRPGMSAVARLRVREAADTVTVPASAVFTADGRDTVWVRTADGTAERRPVTVGVSGTDTLQITDGLREGEQVVVRGADRVTAGDRLP